MTETSLNILAAAPYTTLLTVSWGSNTARYTRWDSDIVLGSETFLSVTQMSVAMGKPFSIGTEDSPHQIRIPYYLPPFDRLIDESGEAHAKVTVLVEEIVPGVPTSRTLRFIGTVGKCKTNSKKSRKIVEAEINGVKADLEGVELGIQSLTTCQHQYGRGLCLANAVSQTLTATVSSLKSGGVINRLQLDFSGSPVFLNNRFASGYLYRDGLAITIRKVYEDGTNPNPTETIDLREIAPADWLNEVVDVVPGCNKTLAACRDPFRNQEGQRLALGEAMPRYHPVFSQNPGNE